MNNKDIIDKLSNMKRKELNRLAKGLKVKNFKEFKKQILINHLITNFQEQKIIKELKISWWKRIYRHYEHIYGIATLIGLILAIIGYLSIPKKEVSNPSNPHEDFNLYEYKDPGKYHPEVYESLITQGHLSYSSKHYREAIGYYNRAIQIIEGIHGKDYLDIINIKIIIGNAYKDRALTGDDKLAIMYYEQAFHIAIKNYGEESIDFALLLKNLDYEWLASKNLQIAILYKEKLKKIYERKFGKEHRDTKSINVELSNLRRKLDKEEMSKEHF